MTDTTTNTSTTPTATAPTAPAHQPTYDTGKPGGPPGDAGAWSPQHEAAHAELQTLRAAMMDPQHQRGSGVDMPRLRFRELTDFLYGNGPVPEHMRPASAKPDPTSPPVDENGFRAADFEKAYAPATRPEEYQVFRHGSRLPDGFDLETGKAVIGDLQQTMMDLRMPAKFGTEIIERFLHHSNHAADDGRGGSTTYLDPQSDFGKELHAEADRLMQPFGGLQKAWEAVEKYMRATLTPEQFKEIASLLVAPDGRRSSAVYDPIILFRILSTARARGLLGY